MGDEATTLRQPLPKKLGKYEIRREVGRGGMGVVYEGYDPIICRRVALKTLITDLLNGPQSETETYVGRLHREAQAAGRLTHPNIVAVYDFGEELQQSAQGQGRIAYIAMEFVEGHGLNDALGRDERFPIPAVLSIMGQLLDALEYSHKNGVVHRDIKPSNIMLLADGSVKVTDFGIARIESSTLTQAGTVMGSPSYMSPEQFLAQTIDGRSDLYSAGVVLYELLTGEVPFSGSFSNVMHKVLHDVPTPPSVLNLHAPKVADEVLNRALAKRPAERFQSAAEFKQALVATLTQSAAGGTLSNVAATRSLSGVTPTQTGAEQPTWMRPAPAVAKTRKAWIPIAAACLVAATAGAGVLAWKSGFWPGAHSAGADGLVNGSGGSGSTGGGQGSSGGGTGSKGGQGSSGVSGSGSAQGGPNSQLPDGGGSQPPPQDVVQTTPLQPSTPTRSGTAVITAVGLADPHDPRLAKQGLAAEPQVWGDARRQLIEKAVALYIDPSSINAHYALLRDKLFSRSDAYISTVLEQKPPQLSRYGLLLGTMRATVRVHDVQKSLNEISRDERVDFIRNNGNPRIAVEVSLQGDQGDSNYEPQRSPIAENVLIDRIRSFGFVAVDSSMAQPPPDFVVNGQVKLKHLRATLPASGITIEKVALTSWTLRTIDSQSGEEVYLNTQIPQKKSWASEELAVQEIGQLIGSQFSRDFFLQYFEFGTRKLRLHFAGLPPTAAQSIVSEATAALRILNATLSGASAREVLIDLDVAGGSGDAAELVTGSLLNPLNRKLGQSCFVSKGSNSATELQIDFDPACANPSLLARLDSLPPGALIDAPKPRIEEIVSDPARLGAATSL